MRLTSRRLAAGLVALGAIAFITGCGGGGDSDALSAEEFRTQADAVCADTDRKIDALTEPTSGDQVLAFLRAGLPIQQAQLDGLKALTPPADLKADFDAALGLLEQQSTAITAAADRIEAGENAEAVLTEVNSNIEGLGSQADEKAKALGLTVCGDTSDSDPAATTAATVATAPTITADPTPTTDTTATAPSAGTGDTAAYVADVQEAAGALQEFGTLLQSTTGLEDLRSKIPTAQASLDTFDAAIAKLDGYTLASGELETQRAGLARTGPAVSDVLRRFLDAANEGDLQAVQSLVPEVTRTIGEFQTAATGG